MNFTNIFSDQHDALYQYYLNQQQEFDANYSSNPTEYGTSTQIGTSGHGGTRKHF